MQLSTQDAYLAAPAVSSAEPELKGFLESWLDVARPQVPRPPSVAMEIVALSRRPDVSIDDIARLLGREPLLAGEVFKMANSALYRGASAATTLKQALVRVGLANVRDLVWDAALRMTVIRAPAFSDVLDRVRRHSTAVAWVSRIVARNTKVAADDAFLIGLLHDVGLSVGLVALCDYLQEHDELMDLTAERWASVLEAHEELGHVLTARWGLPEPISAVVWAHEPRGRELTPSVAVLAVAESVAGAAKWGVGAEHEPEVVTAALEVLGLTERHLHLITTDATPIFATLSQQFGA